MLTYPVLSVLPQNIVYRAFFFHRYRPLFSDGWPMLLASAAAFAFAHIVYRNGLALLFAFVGGLLFARTYRVTRSLSGGRRSSTASTAALSLRSDGENISCWGPSDLIAERGFGSYRQVLHFVGAEPLFGDYRSIAPGETNRFVL